MEIYAKGQLSFMILNCLTERDYYGLDIISRIKERSSGRIVLKKPSVYSSLTRMEKQGQVTSYTQSSDVGPNRRYYSLTEKGKNTYNELKDYFDRNNIDVFAVFVGDGVTEKEPEIEEAPAQEENAQDTSDFFDFSSISQAAHQEQNADSLTQAQQPQPAEDPQPPLEESVSTPEKKDDGKFLTTPPQASAEQPKEKTFSISSLLRKEENSAQEKQEEKSEEAEKTDEKVLSNQEIYDISKDMAKYRRKRSFAEDQMAFAVNEPIEKSNEKTKADIEELKSSILANKGKYNERLTEEQFYGSRFAQRTRYADAQSTKDLPANTLAEKEKNDDGVFITEHSEAPLRSAKKIEPAKLRTGVTDQPLPAPKKDSSIDMSHKEIISKLYSKGKGAENAGDSNFIYDYEDLQDYYKTQGITFRQYEKTSYKLKHNTNKLNLGTSIVCFVLGALASALLFTLFYLTGKANPTTNFLYLVLPALAAVELGYRIYVYKTRSSWEPKPLISQWLVWVFTLLGLGTVLGLNFAFGLAQKNFALFCNSLFLPVAFIAIYLPLYYYVKKALYVKLWK